MIKPTQIIIYFQNWRDENLVELRYSITSIDEHIVCMYFSLLAIGNLHVKNDAGIEGELKMCVVKVYAKFSVHLMQSVHVECK